MLAPPLPWPAVPPPAAPGTGGAPPLGLAGGRAGVPSWTLPGGGWAAAGAPAAPTAAGGLVFAGMLPAAAPPVASPVDAGSAPQLGRIDAEPSTTRNRDAR